MLKMLLAKKGKFMYNDMETMIDTFIIKGAIEDERLPFLQNCRG